jgi:hypothetical protein
VYISVNNNTDFKKNEILSIYTTWDRLSLKPSHATVPLTVGGKGGEGMEKGVLLIIMITEVLLTDGIHYRNLSVQKTKCFV